MKKILYSLIFCCLLGQYAHANCGGINNGPTAGIADCISQGGFFGQAFTACESGEWTTLTFNITTLTGNGTATVYTAEGEIADKALASAAVEGIFTSGTVQTITINRPVSTGSRYIWWVELDVVEVMIGVSVTRTGFSQVCYDVSTGALGADDDYVHSIRMGQVEAVNSGGLSTASAGAAGAGIGGAAAFSIAIVADEASAPIPTLSQWGLLVMGLLVLNLGLIFIRKKESILL